MADPITSSKSPRVVIVGGGFAGLYAAKRLAWLFIHILFLVGFRNRLLVMIQWAWAYVTFQRGARLITGEVRYGRQEGRE